ncbi:MAG: DUF5076 domain-containing protein [Erythrobacter sp.]|uniref:DUF5076 domain-containing protein n=1 Tax=Erythrobacter sp. TaxID=1042 RepID=UPI0026397BAD|nr:DUF5076 domain-containing protein [Erythrobacter sp.]MDJ0979444.1 DUF5076 domain-containing protein [Erythrobacter sp.]
MFGKKAHPNSIDIDAFDFLDDSVEVARLWVENNGPATCLIQPDRLEKPEMFGLLLVDTIRHGAKAYSQCYDISEEEALTRIWAGVEMERAQHTTELDTIQDFQPDPEPDAET